MDDIKDNISLSFNEIRHLRHLLSKLDTSMGSTTTYVHSGMASKAQSPTWIIDSSANRHMTNSSKGLSNYFSCSNGEMSVLPMDRSITKDLNCKIVFYPDYCVFHDLHTEWRIGNGRLRDGLYVLDTVRDSGQACLEVSKDAHQEIIQWRRQLGHPSFILLQKLFPKLFANLSVENLFCDAYKETEVQGETDVLREIAKTSKRLNRPDLSRKNRDDKPEEAIMQSVEPVESSPTGELPTFPNDSDMPIAHRKGVRSCTKHPLAGPLASASACISHFFIMASSKSSSQEASSSNANEFSGNAENSVLLLTRHKLTGQNYLHWSRSMIMFITGKGKEDYLTNSTKPQPDDPKFKTWNAENQMVMSWLINSMDLEIGQDFMFFATAAEIWKAAKESYSDVENTAELFEIKGALHDLKQGELSVPQYFNTLNRYWLQLDMFECPEWKCSEDAATYQKLVEKERIYKFLLGLNKSLDNIRGRILSIKPLPSLREVLSTVRHEESRRKWMLGSLADSDSVNGSALVVHGVSHNLGNGQKKGRPWCDHCHRTGHVKDKCWKLHGKPSD
ncbi:Retrovirus-related Pol polyprotein from transposon TNT 1-94 [Senna tora]|uniref:Retrovirus-related Pol polyprotein from transposon TNT 1-94 n=1 Tax=Senna tora TaxID=362788 RepID=A0A834WJI3_9FABA|nr:Retrovirus-related Pol polyprotein from transposon TNT 1-94 [Senna tora]